MAIGSVMEKGSQIIAYDERNRQLFAKFKGHKPGDGLKGYTGSTVSIQNGSQLLTYDERVTKSRPDSFEAATTSATKTYDRQGVRHRVACSQAEVLAATA